MCDIHVVTDGDRPWEAAATRRGGGQRGLCWRVLHTQGPSPPCGECVRVWACVSREPNVLLRFEPGTRGRVQPAPHVRPAHMCVSVVR